MLFSPYHSTFPPLSRDLAYPSLFWCSFHFSLLILLTPFTTSILLIHGPTNLTLHSTTWWSERPHSIPLTALNAAYPAPDLSYSLPPLCLGLLPLLCNYALLCSKYVLPTHSTLSAQNFTTLLPLSFSNGTPKASVMLALTISLFHPFRSPRINNLYPLLNLSKSCPSHFRTYPFLYHFIH